MRLFNLQRDGKGVSKNAANLPFGLKRFFISYASSFGKLVSVNIFFVLGNFPLLFLIAAFAVFTANAGNIILNGSFETFKTDTDFPADWGVHYIWKGPCRAVNDFGNAHDGSVALQFNQRHANANKEQISVGSTRCATKPGSRYRMSVWAKGDGAVSMTVYFSAKGRKYYILLSVLLGFFIFI